MKLFFQTYFVNLELKSDNQKDGLDRKRICKTKFESYKADLALEHCYYLK